MFPSTGREVIKISVAAVLTAILYRYWLVAPVMQSLTINQWRTIAVVVAAAIGAVTSLMHFPILALACGSTAGLFAGGTWAAWQAPNDVPISVAAAFGSHLESFWWETMMLAVTVTVSGFWTARLAKRRHAKS